MSQRERMSPVDTTWLRMDRPANLMVILGVWVLEGPVALKKARGAARRRALELPALPPESRGHPGRRLLARRSELRPRPSHEAGEAAGSRRETRAGTLCRRPRLRAARSEPSALDDAYRRKIRGRRGGGVPHASRDRDGIALMGVTMALVDGGDNKSRHAGRPGRRRRLAAEPDGPGRGGDQRRKPGLGLDPAHRAQSRAPSVAGRGLSARRRGRRRRARLSALHAQRQPDPLQGQAAWGRNASPGASR